MAIEIREIVIRARVGEPSLRPEPPVAMEQRIREEILRQCERLIREHLADRHER
jgi:hypothetical protein